MAFLLPSVEALRLVDHHCHGVVRRVLDRDGFESMLNEADAAGPLGGSLFDSQVGLAVRRWCAPVLDLVPHAQPEDYLTRRAELGPDEVNRRFLHATGTGALCLDTGFTPDSILSPGEMGGLAQAPAYEIVRLERVAEEVAAAGASARGFADAFRDRLHERTANGMDGVRAVGVKSIAAYRVGLELPAERPSDTEVADAAGQWLASGNPRLANVTLHAFLVWCGIDLGLPVQFHVGYGDADVDLHHCDPLLLTPLLRATQDAGTPITLLHNYPYHRQAGYLAQVFPHVFADVGLATHNLGHRASALIAETLELIPFGKFLYSSDAFGLPELYHLGALLFRKGLSDFLRDGLEDGAWTKADADRFAEMAGAGNARRVYRLDEH